jgi:hypothetical protein
MPRLLSVNVGRPAEVGTRRGRPVRSAIGKAPVHGRVAVAGVNVAGDDQADRQVHGGPDKAVYAYAAEDAAWWAGELGRPLAPGAFGENLTVEGVDVTGAVIGERWRGAPSSSRSASRGCRASSSACASATRRWSGASPRRGARGRTCASSARASWPRAIRSP